MLVNEQLEASQADSQILHPGSRALFRFWEAARAERSAPRRDEIDLTRLRPVIANLAIIERAPGRLAYRWRLAGTGICEIYRQEITGRSVLEGWNDFERDVISRFLEGVTTRLQPCVMRFRLHTDRGQLVGTEFIGLPILAHSGAVHVFGGLFAFRDPTAMDYTAVAAMELSGARSIWTEYLPGDQLVRQLATAQPGRPFQPFQVIAGGRK
jgi:hypothetical protein